MTHSAKIPVMRRWRLTWLAVLALAVASAVAFRPCTATAPVVAERLEESGPRVGPREGDEPRPRRRGLTLSIEESTPSEQVPATSADDLPDITVFPDGARVAQPEHVFRGRVVDPRGEPVAGVRVELISTWMAADVVLALSYPLVGQDEDLEFPHAESVARSAADGSFEVRWFEGGSRWLVLRDADTVRWRGDIPAAWQSSDIVLPDSQSKVRGRVLDERTGETVPGAIVTLWGERFTDFRSWRARTNRGVRIQTTADEGGSYILDGVPAGPAWIDVTQGDRVLVRDVEVKVPTAGELERDLLLPGSFTITGTVVDAETGIALARASVRGVSERVETDAAGRFTLPQEPFSPGQVVSIEVAAPGYARGGGFAPVPRDRGETVEVTLKIGRRPCVRLRCVDRSGQPARDVIVVVRTMATVPGGSEGVVMGIEDVVAETSGSDGWVEVWDAQVRAETTTLVAYRDGVPALELRLDPLQPGEVRDLGSVIVDVPRALRGRVVDATGAPVAGAWVTVAPSDREDDELHRLAGASVEGVGGTGRQAQTAADGSFAVLGLHEGTWDAYATGANLPDRVIRGVVVPPVSDPSQLEFRLPRGVVLAGRVLDDGAPVVGATVVVERPRSIPLHFSESRTTDADGRFSFEGFPEGVRDVQVHVTLAGDEPRRESFRVTPADGPVDLRL